MKYLLLISWAVLITPIAARSQPHKMDSLALALNHESTDTGRALLMIAIGKQLLDIKPDSAMVLAENALMLSRSSHFRRGETRSLNLIGNIHYLLGDYPAGLANQFEALKTAEETSDVEGRQNSLAGIASEYESESDFHTAIGYLMKSNELDDQTHNERRLSSNLGSIGYCYEQLGNVDSAIIITKEAFRHAARIGDTSLMASCYGSLAGMYFKKGDDSGSLDYCRASLPFLAGTQSYYAMAVVDFTAGKVFDRIDAEGYDKKDSVLFYLMQSLEIAKSRKYTVLIRNAASYLARFYRPYNPDSSYSYSDLARAMSDSMFNQEKQRQLQNIEFAERIRQQELAAKELKAKEVRKHNLQFAATGAVIILLLTLFFVFSRTVLVGQRFIRFFGVLGLLAVFEFINLLIHPVVARFTDESPVYMLIVLVAVASVLIPAHHALEHWITDKLIEKNRKIRLEQAKKITTKPGS